MKLTMKFTTQNTFRAIAFALTLGLFGVSTPVLAQQTASLPAWDEIDYPEIKNFAKPEVESFTLDNGMEFYLIEDTELPLITLRVTIRTGGILDPANKTGLTNILGDVIRSGGSENYPADELNQLLESKAASIETFGGFTSMGASMSLLKEDFDELLPVFVDVVQNPRLPEDKIDLSKTQYKSSVSRRNDNQASIANREFERLIYGEDSPYGRMMEYETIDAVTREDLVKRHEEAFKGSNMLVGIVGDFDKEEMQAKLERAFGALPAGSAISLLPPEIDYEFKSSVNLVDKPDVNQSYVLMGHIGGLRSNPDYAALQVMNQVLSGGFSGRLFQVVRTDLGLAYSVFGAYTSGTLYEGQFYTGVMTKSSTTAEAIDAIRAEVERIQAEPVSDEELQKTKDQFLNSLVFRYDSRAKVLNQRLSNEYAGLPQDAFDQLIEEIKAVGIEDVQRVAKEYLRPDALQILVVGNAEELGDQLEKYGEVNQIDITIPTPSDDAAESTESGDAAGGAEWFGRMAQAILPGGSVQGALTTKATTEVQTPQGPMELPVTNTIDLDAMKVTSGIETPAGTMTIEITENSGSQSFGAQSMPMSAEQVDQAWQELYASPTWMALHADSYTAEYLGETEEGLIRLRVSADMMNANVEVHLDPETALPVMTSMRTFNAQVGANVTTESDYSDWKEVEGVLQAYVRETRVEGNLQSSTVLQSHSVE